MEIITPESRNNTLQKCIDAESYGPFSGSKTIRANYEIQCGQDDCRQQSGKPSS